ncbi:hypothetical protein [Riemerella columbina]|uniref:hypothetical protein n=1 Tax=Riemerella columbina TaxID=103810 RepID=UPI00037129D2|nr:hypothetical protein [Riemerella columbina]
MKKTIINLAVFAAVGLSTQVFGQQEKTQGVVGVNIDKPHATLEVKTFDENGTSVEGVLIPRVSRQRAASMGTTVAESTLIYVDDVSNGSLTGTTSLVNEKGFYFFKEKVWQKLGGSPSNTRYVWNTRTDNGTTVTILPTDDLVRLTNNQGGTINMPDVMSNKGRQICFYNQGNANFRFVPDIAVGQSQSAEATLSSCYISDGTNWVNITAY